MYSAHNPVQKIYYVLVKTNYTMHDAVVVVGFVHLVCFTLFQSPKK